MVRRILLGGVVFFLAISAHSRGQDAEGPYPKFKDGVAIPPPAAIVEAPFDVARLFAAPPIDLNAAPLYLDALYEFGNELRGCFPEGPENDARFHAMTARHKQETEVEIALEKDPKSVSDTDVDAMLANYDEGFRKLAAAQLRPHCVFQTGVGFTALLPHVQAARQVARVASIKVRRELEQGRIDDALADVRIVLRLTRDLQKRGYLITELVVTAMESVVASRMIEPILAAPGLDASHCDSLAAILDDYVRNSIDPYAESLEMEYTSIRVTLLDLVSHQAKLGKALGVHPGASVVKAMIGPLEVVPFRKGDAPGQAPISHFPEDIDATVARATPKELDEVVGRLNAYYTHLLDLKGRTRLEQIRKMPRPDEFFKGDDPFTRILRALQPSVDRLAPVFGRGEATLRASQALTTVRRWQLTHEGASPTDLEAASKAAGLKSAPVDPFDGQPLRLVILNGEPLVYSIGKDGKDDGGKLDSNLDRNPGDLIYRLKSRK